MENNSDDQTTPVWHSFPEAVSDMDIQMVDIFTRNPRPGPTTTTKPLSESMQGLRTAIRKLNIPAVQKQKLWQQETGEYDNFINTPNRNFIPNLTPEQRHAFEYVRGPLAKQAQIYQHIQDTPQFTENKHWEKVISDIPQDGTQEDGQCSQSKVNLAKTLSEAVQHTRNVFLRSDKPETWFHHEHVDQPPKRKKIETNIAEEAQPPPDKDKFPLTGYLYKDINLMSYLFMRLLQYSLEDNIPDFPKLNIKIIDRIQAIMQPDIEPVDILPHVLCIIGVLMEQKMLLSFTAPFSKLRRVNMNPVTLLEAWMPYWQFMTPKLRYQMVKKWTQRAFNDLDTMVTYQNHEMQQRWITLRAVQQAFENCHHMNPDDSPAQVLSEADLTACKMEYPFIWSNEVLSKSPSTNTPSSSPPETPPKKDTERHRKRVWHPDSTTEVAHKAQKLIDSYQTALDDFEETLGSLKQFNNVMQDTIRKYTTITQDTANHLHFEDDLDKHHQTQMIPLTPLEVSLSSNSEDQQGQFTPMDQDSDTENTPPNSNATNTQVTIRNGPHPRQSKHKTRPISGRNLCCAMKNIWFEKTNRKKDSSDEDNDGLLAAKV